MSLDLFGAHHFLALPPLSPEKKNTPSTPTHQWVSVVVIFQEIKYSSKVCGGRICDERTHNVFKKDPQKEQMNTNYLLTPT